MSKSRVILFFTVLGATLTPHISTAAPVWACSQLHEAAFLDEPDEIREALAYGIDINCKDVLGQTALVTAVNGASIDSFGVLLDAGARVDVRTEFGQTLLQHTQKKFRSVDQRRGMEQYRDLFQTMIARLQLAGADH